MRSRTADIASRAVLSVLLTAAFTPTVVYAEPGVSRSHLPLLWLIVAVGASVCAVFPWLIRRWTRTNRPRWVFWMASVVLAVLFLMFFGPLIVALGSILITGRTM